MNSISPVLLKPFSTALFSSAKERASRVDLKNLAISGWPTPALTAATTWSNGLEEVRLNRSISIFLIISNLLTAVVDVEIRLSARWRVLPRRRYSVRHYAERRHDSDLDSCRRSCSVFWKVPLYFHL